jgi:hypothetical protein
MNQEKCCKGLFESKLEITFDSKETVLELNGCTIEAYPSNHIDDRCMLSLTLCLDTTKQSQILQLVHAPYLWLNKSTSVCDKESL